MGEYEFENSPPKQTRLIHKNAKLFRQLFESMNEGCALHKIIFDQQGEPIDYTILEINPAYETILGLGRDIIGKKASEVFKTEKPPYLDIVARVASSGKPCSFNTSFAPLNKYYKMSVFSPDTGYFATVFSDVSDRIMAEERLKQSESLYRSLFENMLNGFAYCQMVYENDQPTDFIYLAVNKAFEDSTGLKNVVGKRASEIIPGIQTSDPGLIATYGRVASGGSSERFEQFLESMQMRFEVSVFCPQKGYFVALFNVTPERK